MEMTAELLAAYAEGNVSEQERQEVRRFLTDHPELLESVMIMMDKDYDIQLESDWEQTVKRDSVFNQELNSLIDEVFPMDITPHNDILPMMALAAQNVVDNLCAVRCEGFALRQLGFDISDEVLLEESRREGWLKPQGTALHDIGRLAGQWGLNVSHRYNCTTDDIAAALTAHHVVLAVVDGGELSGDIEQERAEDKEIGRIPDHVVVIQSIEEQTITIIDSSTLRQTDSYPIPQFMDAWQDSSNYLIIISNDELYEPHPIDLSDVVISDDLIELREAIAENAHEVWAYNRRREGWTYGPERDDTKKLHPDMLPYNRLPESEKQYDREMAINTIKLVQKLGWEIKKR